ncbi:MAG TPA: polysaccharide biosynthesis/export family protein [Bryobacteraceae bacterium]|jgi:polysaccharide export outer membrane protein
MLKMVCVSSTWCVVAFLALPQCSLAQDHLSAPLPEAGANLPARPLEAGDLTAVVVYGAPELSRTVRVSAEGAIHLPMLERRIDVAGRMPSEVEDRIAAALVAEQILKDPAVTVTIAEYHSRPISVVGAVRQPLTFPAYGKITLLEALARAQGLNTDAGTEILVTHPSHDALGAPVVERVSLKGLIDGADPALNLTLNGGEEIRVPRMGRVFVVGNVRKPGGFPAADGAELTVLKALALAEGLAPFSKKEGYIYRRPSETSPTTEIVVELRKIMDRKAPDVALGANDILYIPDSRSARVTATVIEKAIAFVAGTASGALILSAER